jgi:hypothetical protein
MCSRLFLAACWLLGFTFAACGVELVEGPAVQTTDTTAIIRWKTDVECGTRVRFGLSEHKLDGRAGEGVAVAHEVTLTGLKQDTAYAYSVGSAKVVLKSDMFMTTKTGQPVKQGGLISKIKDALSGNRAPTASSQSGTAAPAGVKRAAPPAGRTWGSPRTLQDHFDRHGADFRATSPADYAGQAWEFLQRAMDEGLPAKLDDSDGTLRVWDARSGAFAAYNRDRTTRTYFKPGNPDYFARQPGRIIKLKRSE